MDLLWITNCQMIKSLEIFYADRISGLSILLNILNLFRD